MYEPLTQFIDRISPDNVGEWGTGCWSDDRPEPAMFMPAMHYSDAVSELCQALEVVISDNAGTASWIAPDILAQRGIDWNTKAFREADVSTLDGDAILALLDAVFQLERFGDGLVGSFIRNGCITKWLIRLREIDEQGRNTSCRN